MDLFGCISCDSPSIALPTRLDYDAIVVCKRCGEPFGTWSELQNAAERMIAATFPNSSVPLSADPLPRLGQLGC
jgi:hypothetical protein